MRHLTWKIGLFVIIWYTLAIELRMGADAAFLTTLGVLVGGWMALRLAGQAALMMGR